MKEPQSNYDRVKRARAKAIKAGGRRMPDGILSPEVSQALNELIESEYAQSAFGVISAAILDAHRKIKRL